MAKRSKAQPDTKRREQPTSLPEQAPVIEVSAKPMRLSWLPLFLFGLIQAIWLFPAIFQGRRFSFRDISHFYLPLYQYTTERLLKFDLPVWNPLILTGVPVVGDNTSAIFYPARLVFLLGFSTETSFIFYFLMHVFLAAFGARYAALRAGAKPEYAWLAALTYGLAAPVVQLYNNPVFLVGAAWLPWAVSGLFQVIDGGSRRAIALTALALAMPVLGGDPQATMHALMIAFALYCFQWWKNFRSESESSASIKTRAVMSSRKLHTRAIVLACGLAFTASLIQVLPTMQWSKHSGRSAEAPFGVARLIAGKAVEETDRAWYQFPTPGTHAKLIYNYSIGPWNVVELCFPNLWGEAKPVVSRMSRLISSEEMFWTTSIYCGLLAFLTMCLTPWCKQWNRWWFLGIFACLLAFGHFGIVAGLQNLNHASPKTALGNIEPGLGTPYWFLVTFFPGYASFRYPCKWMPAAVLGFSVALSLWFTFADERNIRRLQRICMAIIGIGLFVFILCFIPPFRSYIIEVEKPKATVDQYFGPLELNKGFIAIQWGCVHGCLCAAFLWYRTRTTIRGGVKQDHKLPYHLATFLALDLLIAGFAWIEFAPRERETLSQLSADVRASLKREGAVGSPLALRTIDEKRLLMPWMSCTSPMRSIELDLNEQRTLMALWPLTHHIALINTAPTIAPRVHTSFWQVIGDHVSEYQQRSKAASNGKEVKDPNQMSSIWKEVLRWMSVRAVVTLGPPEMVYPDPTTRLMVTSPVWELVDEPLPTVRWYDRWEASPGDLEHPAETWQKLVKTLCENKAESHPAWIGVSSESLPKQVAAGEHTDLEQIHLSHSDAESVHIEVKNGAPGWVYFHVFQDGNWIAELRSKGESGSPKIVRPEVVNLIGQGVYLAPGEWEIKLLYQPSWLWYGTLASSFGWIGIGYLAFRSRPRNSLVPHARQAGTGMTNT